MRKNEIVEKIHQLHAFGKKSGLDGITELMTRLGNPQAEMDYVHVAGTNGKGSVTSTVASVLKEAGYKTGKFLSPFITDFSERMQINDQCISDRDLVDLGEIVFTQVDKMNDEGRCPTEFEVVTAIAFLWFAKEKCDIVCMETGLGGRFDATNIITPKVSVITAIGMDHMKYLGDNLGAIAYEKCGIIKQGVPVVTDPCQDVTALGVIMEQSARKATRLIIPQRAAVKEWKTDIHGTSFDYDDRIFHTPLIGEHQVRNGLISYETLKVLGEQGIGVSKPAIQKGLANVQLPARMEIISTTPLVILDGAHNPQGAKALEEFLKTVHCPMSALIGMAEDKEMDSVMGQVLPLCTSVVTTSLQNPRGATARTLASLADRYCPAVVAQEDQIKALELALSAVGNTGGLIIFGSLYLAGDLRPELLKRFH